MISLQNLANQKFSTSASSSNNGKWQSQTKLQEHATATTTVDTQNRCTTSALTVAEHQRTRTKAIENPRTTQTLKLLTKDLPKATSEVELQTEVVGEVEADIHQYACTACTMATKSTISPKATLSTSTPSTR
jgi:hypothetical protein